RLADLACAGAGLEPEHPPSLVPAHGAAGGGPRTGTGLLAPAVAMQAVEIGLEHLGGGRIGTFDLAQQGQQVLEAEALQPAPGIAALRHLAADGAGRMVELDLEISGIEP